MLEPMRYGYSVFCDDIRNEVGGKLSFIGCYNGVMFVPSGFPLTFPKICVHFHVVSPASMPYSSIVVRCYIPAKAEPLVEEPLQAPSVDEQRRLAEQLEAGVSAPRLIVASGSFIFAPLEIREPGLIRMRAVIDNEREETKLGALRIVPLDEAGAGPS
jgi:hypothetical protein